ncbi:MAG TPA: ATP-binding protein, partial [Aggregatilineales bacterium]|nr:ATP-binding protein [Aggregatilineales bacterium]
HNHHEDPDFLPELGSGEHSVLLDLLNQSGARAVLRQQRPETGYADQLPFPFLALVQQYEMRIALLLSVINPSVGGVLLIGPRGTGKTTCVRSLTGILPEIEVEDTSADYQKDETVPMRWQDVKIVELPLNARLEEVVGGINERIAVQQNRIKLEPGILARANHNVLYIDEVNLLDDSIVDAILDAAAQGSYTVRRGAMSGTFEARFILIGSMNPEEGRLRPQIMDRFGLRVAVRGLTGAEPRLEVYHRVREYREGPRAFVAKWADITNDTRELVTAARVLLKDTVLSEEALQVGLELVQRLEIDSHRAEFSMFEAARAHAAADGRQMADLRDLRIVAPLALRQRRSQFMIDFFVRQEEEDHQIRTMLDEITPVDE